MRLFQRVALTVMLPFCLIIAVSLEFCRGIKRAFRDAWLEVLIEMETYHDAMHGDDLWKKGEDLWK